MMANPNVAIEKLRVLENEINDHPCCLRLEQYGNGYLVILPLGFRVDGVRSNLQSTKTKNAELILNKLEEIWADSFL